jgi:hypothetical protein
MTLNKMPALPPLAEVAYCCYDRKYPALWRWFGAWCFKDGKWQEIEREDQAEDSFYVLSKENFDREFGKLPPPPKEALVVRPE